jgi:hypothetical protein
MTLTYQTDFKLWLEETSQLLLENRWEEIDKEHLIEEICELGKSERRAILSQLVRLILHLLKWQYQPQRRSDSWLDSITDARTQIELTIKDSPSLKNYPQEQLQETYEKARRQAAKQTGLMISTFSEECLYSLELILDENWLPE